MKKYLLIIVVLIIYSKGIAQNEIDSLCAEPVFSIEEALNMKNCLIELSLLDEDSKQNKIGNFRIDTNFNKCLNLYVLEVFTKRKLILNFDFSIFQKLNSIKICGKIRNNTFNKSVSKINHNFVFLVYFEDNECMLPTNLLKANTWPLILNYYKSKFDTLQFLKNLITLLPITNSKVLSFKAWLEEKVTFNENLKPYIDKIKAIVKRKNIVVYLFGNRFDNKS